MERVSFVRQGTYRLPTGAGRRQQKLDIRRHPTRYDEGDMNKWTAPADQFKKTISVIGIISLELTSRAPPKYPTRGVRFQESTTVALFPLARFHSHAGTPPAR